MQRRDLEDFLAAQEGKGRLRFLTCGSVDDGKSTLLGRLLYESKCVFEDQLASTAAESRSYGTQGSEVDLALLVDGLQAEREQGITIDVAYRFFETDKRKFIAADAPGHEQYTRNMATGASTADLAVILVDARKGLLEQTRRHSFIAHLLGIKAVVLAVNKMDLVDYDQATYARIVVDYGRFAQDFEFTQVRYVPLSALTGENVVSASGAMPWYAGPSFLEILETIDVASDSSAAAFRFPVQWVNRPDPEFRGFSGTIAAGQVERGATVQASLSGKTSAVTRILGPSGDLEIASAGQSVTLVLAEEIDVSRGDMLAAPDGAPEVADQFAAHLIWMDATPMLPERPYLIRFATASATAQVTDLTYRIEVNTLEQLAAKTLEMNEIGYCKIALDRPVPFDAYADNRQTGSFVLIDKITNATVGAGTVSFALRRATNISWQELRIDKAVRAGINDQAPCILWFTGLSGAGKSTVADLLEQALHAEGKRTYLLDGDNVRHGLNKDLGFTDQDRVENIRRVAEVAKLMVDAGLIVLVSFISPFRSERQMARDLVEADEFVEIFVDAPLEVCESRDPKGLYKKARSGQLKNFTGIDSDYEPPDAAEVTLKSGEASPQRLVEKVIDYLRDSGRI